MTKRFLGQLILLVTVCGAGVPAAQAQAVVGCNAGKPDAPIRIEVFSDYECPTCRAFYLQTMKLVLTNYADTGKVCIVYREFPSYPHSREAAKFARSALRLGPRQWRLVADALYQSQPQWHQSGNIEAVVAPALGAKDMDALRKHLTDPKFDDIIDADAIMGLQRKVESTPTMFITAGGKTETVAAALTYAGMQRRLDALAAQGPR